MSKTKGRISVTVQREDRLKAIVHLSKAIERVAYSLSVPVEVHVTGCNIKTAEVGVSIDTAEDVTRTIIKEIK
ncbi:hypothetical protein LCGC14_2060620 [marine sediment metagenome]|uniref:Uncharacterized protein n=1 Tax=marine sediment metagenome TaxID=412755 RepID=A0A0F9EL95_9ZZZZ